MTREVNAQSSMFASLTWKHTDGLWEGFKIALPFTLLRRLGCVLEPTTFLNEGKKAVGILTNIIDDFLKSGEKLDLYSLSVE
ncbi:hypothetical protein LPB140_08890 [Sphingorhabdus lutea]|uniref:Uncharacterized protein n=1 Tax=Sphingorhabdus lutea TaxID=1913578 RepID=A0A1L3JCL7_9SPHN|nr:hypothetical protein [Sphingorhabdus lutea]APG62885.1 hypothetical protein LPB140_08890 [Sphingorhabdus lutea]